LAINRVVVPSAHVDIPYLADADYQNIQSKEV
jgi:hypothetical protein